MKNKIVVFLMLTLPALTQAQELIGFIAPGSFGLQQNDIFPTGLSAQAGAMYIYPTNNKREMTKGSGYFTRLYTGEQTITWLGMQGIYGVELLPSFFFGGGIGFLSNRQDNTGGLSYLVDATLILPLWDKFMFYTSGTIGLTSLNSELVHGNIGIALKLYNDTIRQGE